MISCLVDSYKRYSITEEDVKICFSEMLFKTLERNYMRGSISIENISFSRNCDIKITNAKSVYLGDVFL